MIRLLEELSMHAWPALETLAIDGWILRFSAGYTRRANSVHPLGCGAGALPWKIEQVERLYREHKLPPIFKLTSQSLPEGLEETLAERGYSEEARTSVQVAPIAASERGATRIETSWEKSEEWRRAFHHMSDVAPGRRAIHDRILGSISLPTGFASIVRDKQIVACALGVVECGWLGVFDVVVDESVRRRGHGESLMRSLMVWGQEMGAENAYLQVMLSNAPALALYDRLGFREAYQYWYRLLRFDGTAQPEPGASTCCDEREADYGFSYQATDGGEVFIRRFGQIVTRLRRDAARAFLADVDGASREQEQELMARYTGNYRHGNEHLAGRHPRHSG